MVTITREQAQQIANCGYSVVISDGNAEADAQCWKNFVDELLSCGIEIASNDETLG